MAKQPKRGELKEKNSVTVKFEHLNPAVQSLIKTEGHILSGIRLDASISELRKLRGTAEIGAALGIAGGTASLLDRKSPSAGFFYGAATSASLLRGITGRRIRRRHEDIKEAMNRYGILHTRHEESYPFSWHNPAIVAKTHPVFYVKGNGDVVFRKSTRTEYFRYLAQQKKLVRVPGIQPWRWRVYLQPPTAPEKVKVWARAKLAALKPARQPALVPVGARRKATH